MWTRALLCLGLLILYSPAKSDTNLTLGPEVLTFPEIADKLSVQGHLVECSPTLRSRAAYVYLKDRSWAQARELLSAGLQARLRHTDKKTDQKDTWILERDPQVLAREQTWRRQFAEGLRQYALDQKQIIERCLAMSPQERKAELESVQSELQPFVDRQAELDKASPSGPANVEGEGVHATRYLQLSLTAEMLSNVEFMLKEAEGPLNLLWWHTYPPAVDDVVTALATGYAWRSADAARIPRDALTPLLKRIRHDTGRDLPDRYDVVVGGYQFAQSSTGMSLSAFAAMISPNAITLFTRYPALQAALPLSPFMGTGLTETIFGGTPADVTPQYNGLGKQGARWLQAEREQTQKLLKDDRAHQTLVYKNGLSKNALSQVLEAWSRQYDAEAIMELWPQREGVQDDPTAHETASLAGCFDTRSNSWTLRMQNGALIAQNRLAFLDRPQNLPVAPLIRLIRRQQARATAADKEGDSFLYEDLRDYCRDALRNNCALWGYPARLIHYRGQDVMSLDWTLSAIYLWDRLSPTERKDLLDTALKDMQTRRVGTGFADLSLFHFTGRDRDILAEWERKRGFENAQCLHPGYADALANATLNLQVIRTRDSPHIYEYSLRIASTQNPDLLIVNGSARFLWTP